MKLLISLLLLVMASGCWCQRIDCPSAKKNIICGNAVPAGTVLGCDCQPILPPISSPSKEEICLMDHGPNYCAAMFPHPLIGQLPKDPPQPEKKVCGILPMPYGQKSCDITQVFESPKPLKTIPTSVSVTVLPPNSVKSFEIAKDGKCPDGYSKQWGSGFDSFGNQVGETRYDCVEQPQQPKPLKCEKYQHVEPAHCANTCSASGSLCTTQCIFVSESCAPDLHPVTESEWQYRLTRDEILERELRDLELALAANNERLKVLEQHQSDIGEFIKGLIEGSNKPSQKRKP